VTSYRLHRGNFRKQVLQADWMVAEMRARADKGLEFAEAAAPRSTGAYSTKFRVRVRKSGGIHHDRAEAILYNTDPAALAIEFGHFENRTESGNFAPTDAAGAEVPFRRAGAFVPGHHTLTRALDAMGG
jgi:hypothetical protein